ncbi:hypothetical protein KL930_001107 [Ogataea haglerorum]|uniref:Catabolite repression protein creC n=1 Tax=Ogataea haglerorum TaxID=1937702 RepID=A0AAN6D981_9ASCO|nr:hypothetical protein KL915_001108 [Ogataea haglerorum]KAG7711892.1 hypothetical protein KL914_000534 [Ogataea haglerorum]KAG7712663.1 hypothetical protein KL950_000534 [Ogataea haglerorum]KAG7722713.1 hypothetical protein KL913_000533 [Ogataea haglerorum]KAG7723185.1 hypothetical protein KL949_000235 [Ogataea haglerorum]
MYLPPDLCRYNKVPPNQFQNVLSNSILPIQSTDPNCVFRLQEQQFSFDHLDGTFVPDVAIRISRTPLNSSDPSTYASLSKFVEQNLRKYHTTLGNINQNQLINPLSRPPEQTGVQPDGKGEVLPVGYGINPLIADSFKNVHLTPGCFADIINFDKSSSSNNEKRPSNPTTARLWGKQKPVRTDTTIASDDLKSPKSNLSRSTSNFISKVSTADNYNRKYSNASSVLVGCHGRIINLISLEEDLKETDVEIPLLKVVFSSSIITTFSCFHYTTTSGERNLDILVAFASGDIFWLSFPKLKYSRWNKNAKLKNKPVMSLQWSQCGSFAVVGFADGEVMVFHRDFEDAEVYEENKAASQKSRHMTVLKSLSSQQTGSNPVSHYKFSYKAITKLKYHPAFPNIWTIASDDGFVRLFDFFSEVITDIVPSYYGGILDIDITKDGRYMVCGGEDDFVSIYEFSILGSVGTTAHGLLKLIARLEGAKSWVRGVCIDYFKTTPGVLYRIGTVGDDETIRFYEFQPRNLPKARKLKNDKIKLSINQRQKSSLTLDSGSNASMKHLLLSESIKKSWLQNSRSQTWTESVSSLTSSTQLQQLSLYEKINQDQSEGSRKEEQQPGASKARHVLFKDIKTILNVPSQSTIIHEASRWRNCPILFPIGEKNVQLGRLSGLQFQEEYVWAFISTGDLIRWRRPKKTKSEII